MPALPPVNKVIRCAFKHALGDAPFLNILFCAYSGTQGSVIDLEGIANSLAGFWHTDIQQGQSTDAVLQDVTLTDLTSDTAPVATVTPGTPGALSEPVLPASTSIVVSHKIDRRYRGGHPRTYLGGLTNVEMATPQTLPSARIAFWNGAWADLRTDIETLTASHFAPLTTVNVSYKSGGVLRVTPVVDTIDISEVQPRLCNQRRRLGSLLVE